MKKQIVLILVIFSLTCADEKQLLFVSWQMNLKDKTATGRQVIESPFNTVEDVNKIEKYLLSKCNCENLVLTNIVPIGTKHDTVYIRDTVYLEKKK